MNNAHINVIATADGKSVRLDIEQDGKKLSIPLPAKDIGPVVVGLLNAAIACGRNNPASVRPFSEEHDRARLAYAMAKGVALQDTDRPDVVGMIFAFGETEVNLGLSREALRPLGTALLAATADSNRPH